MFPCKKYDEDSHRNSLSFHVPHRRQFVIEIDANAMTIPCLLSRFYLFSMLEHDMNFVQVQVMEFPWHLPRKWWDLVPFSTKLPSKWHEKIPATVFTGITSNFILIVNPSVVNCVLNLLYSSNVFHNMTKSGSYKDIHVKVEI